MAFKKDLPGRYPVDGNPGRDHYLLAGAREILLAARDFYDRFPDMRRQLLPGRDRFAQSQRRWPATRDRSPCQIAGCVSPGETRPLRLQPDAEFPCGFLTVVGRDRLARRPQIGIAHLPMHFGIVVCDCQAEV
jgi:hypothetical protein